MLWFRCRFFTDADDYRPVTFPPPGPYWRTGQTMSGHIIVAYLQDTSELLEYWPEAYGAEYTAVAEIVYTDRFPKPSWWHHLRGKSWN